MFCANTSSYWVAGYVQRDYSVGVLLKDLGKVLTVSYAHNIDPTSSVGAEVTKKLEEKEATVFALGCAQRQVMSRRWASDKSSLLSCFKRPAIGSSWLENPIQPEAVSAGDWARIREAGALHLCSTACTDASASRPCC